MKTAKRLLIVVLPVATCLLSSCQGSPFQDSDFVNKIFPNGMWDFVIQLIAFVVLLLIVFFLGYKPVKKMLTKRQEKIDAMIEDAKANQKVAKEAAAAKDATIDEGKKEAGVIVADARKQAQAEAAQIIAKAEEEAALKRKKADADIEDAKVKAKQEIQDQIIDVAMEASSKILGREVSKKDNEELLEDFLQGMDK